uniref:Uncharacterized protein n=1 Tax=Hucho hucho TaxID=62062 RepID=A0A4W5K0L6_9TELE
MSTDAEVCILLCVSLRIHVVLSTFLFVALCVCSRFLLTCCVFVCRLPGPTRVSAAGSGAPKGQGSSNLNRRSQSFNSIDKSKFPFTGTKGPSPNHEKQPQTIICHPPNFTVGAPVPTSLSGQQLASAIPSPTAGKSWRSKSMNMKHSATSSMLSVSTSPSPSPTPPPRSMLEKFRMINPRSASRTSPSVAEMALQEEDDMSEYGEEGLSITEPTSSMCTSSSNSTKQLGSSTSGGSSNKSLPQPKDKEDKSRSKGGKASTPPKEEQREPMVDPSKKTSKIASLIPKGGKPAAGKKDSAIPPASSGIPKPGLKAPSATGKPAGGQAQTQAQAQATQGGSGGGREGDKSKVVKGGQGGYYMQQRSLGGNGAVQLPQQQQHNHPNTATVAPFMYR